MIYILIFIQQAIASMTHIVGSAAMHSAPAPLVLLFRSSIAGVVLYIISSLKEKKINLFAGLTRKDIELLCFLGFLNILINQFLYLEGLRFTTPANSALLYALTPVLVFILVLIIHRERTSLKKSVGIFVAFIGVAILIFEHGATLDSAYTKGNLMVLVAVLAWSLFTLLGKPLVEKYGALRVTALHMSIGAIMFLPMGLFLSTSQEFEALTPIIWGEILYLAIMASCVNYFLWYYALGKLQTSKVAVFQNLQPILTTIVAIIIGKAVLSGELVLGGILALIGVLIVERA
jgi:drug/metabolite transporter (DMT)-like permease